MKIRPALPAEFDAIEKMVIDAFEPVTWARPLDDSFGPLNGLDWRRRWVLRMKKIFETQIILAGEADGALVATSTSTLDAPSSLAYIDLLAVDRYQQKKGYGREMLRGTLRHMSELGARYVQLDCLTTNDAGNELYRSEGFEEVARHIRWFRKID